MKTTEMKFTKSTKNTHVYNDDSDGAPVPTLYIKRDAMPSTPPATIKITIDWEDA